MQKFITNDEKQATVNDLQIGAAKPTCADTMAKHNNPLASEETETLRLPNCENWNRKIFSDRKACWESRLNGEIVDVPDAKLRNFKEIHKLSLDNNVRIALEKMFKHKLDEVEAPTDKAQLQREQLNTAEVRKQSNNEIASMLKVEQGNESAVADVKPNVQAATNDDLAANAETAKQTSFVKSKQSQLQKGDNNFEAATAGEKRSDSGKINIKDVQAKLFAVRSVHFQSSQHEEEMPENANTRIKKIQAVLQERTSTNPKTNYANAKPELGSVVKTMQNKLLKKLLEENASEEKPVPRNAINKLPVPAVKEVEITAHCSQNLALPLPLERPTSTTCEKATSTLDLDKYHCNEQDCIGLAQRSQSLTDFRSEFQEVNLQPYACQAKTNQDARTVFIGEQLENKTSSESVESVPNDNPCSRSKLRKIEKPFSIIKTVLRRRSASSENIRMPKSAFRFHLKGLSAHILSWHKDN